MGKLARDTLLLLRRSLLQLLRTPAWIFVGLSAPLLYLAFFAPLLRGLPGVAGHSTGAALDEFLPAILALLAFSSGIGPGFNVIFELQAGVIERLRVTPTARLALLLGPILANALSVLVFDSLLVVVGVAFGFAPSPVGLLVLATLLVVFVISVAAFSMALALATKEIQGFAAVMNGLNLPVMLLAGVLLPLTLGPLWLQVLGHFDPLYYLVACARSLAAGRIATEATWHAFAVLVPLCAGTLAWATRIFRTAVA